MHMKLGIGTYSYMWSIGFPGAEPERPMTWRDLLATACELGVRVVQYGPNLPLDGLPESEIDDLAARAHKAGIELELGTRGIETAHVERQIALARRLGASLLRSVPELSGGVIPPRDEMLALLRAAVPHLAAARVRLALENTAVPAALLAGILGELSSEWVGITLDTVNSLAIPEGTEQVARTLAPYTFCLHVKDFTVRRLWHMMGFTVEGRPAGQGQLNVPWLLGVLRDAGVSPNAILELWPPQQSTLNETLALEQAWAVESIAYLRRLIPD
jgi:sugar phosphate isomerase/epimerase